MSQHTADLFDQYRERLQVLEPMFRHFGMRRAFSGPVQTVKVFEDNSLVRAELEKPGDGRVLVVDGGGSLRCALVGDQLARLAIDNGWAGIVVYGCIRDSAAIDQMDIGIKALNTSPAKSAKNGEGQRDIALHFAQVTVPPGAYLYADEDGVVVSDQQLDEKL